MDDAYRVQVIASASAAERLEAATAFLRQFPPTQPVTIVGASRGAADDLARSMAVERGATIGLARFSLTQLAARIAASRLTGLGVAPATALGSEAVAARVAFDAVRSESLAYLQAVAATPGFARALAGTMGELRQAGVAADQVAAAGDAGPDLARLLAHAEQELLDAGTADRARLLAAAAEAAPDEPWLRQPLLLLDPPITSPGEARFIQALVAAATHACITVPAHDDHARAALGRLTPAPTYAAKPLPAYTAQSAPTYTESRRPGSAGPAGDLDCLRTYLFSDAAPPERDPDGSLQFFSAPGEGREAVEIARRVLEEARRGVRFDEMAILLRSPQQYHGLLEHALDRAGVPAWFDRGTRRPHPAGRAFLALLACAAENLSAARFAEYLSLGQIPDGTAVLPHWAAADDEVLGAVGGAAGEGDPVEEADPDATADDEQPAVAGTLRTPRRWERLLVEAAVIGGDPARWSARLAGLDAELATRLAEAERSDATSSRAQGIARDLQRLAHLRVFALPLVTEMAAWPARALWGEWLERLAQVAPRVLRTPEYVLRVLADLRPMATVGPVAVREVQAVLADRLRLVEAPPPARRYGRVFVSSPAQARGRSFRVVFLPGLAERMFPQKPRQDPLLLDGAREQVSASLATRPDRGRAERLLLHLAAGAATERLYVSYPRLEVAEGRARVPSFYALDVLRGITGRVPDHEALADAAASATDAALAWPAPPDPARAIDDQEHDLAVLRLLLDSRDPDAVRGHAQYMLRLNPALRRSVTERWARGERKWSPFDGLIRFSERTQALARHRLAARPYSLSALQRFAACPYQFLLAAIYRLEPSEQPQPLQRLDPLTKGSLVHRMQAETFRALEARGALPVTAGSLDEARATLDEVIARVAGEARQELAPAIHRVWEDEIAAIARDLRGWLRGVASDGEDWIPRYFELAFGLPAMAEGRDPRSVPEPVTLDGRFRLRGSIDLVEEHRARGVLRVTDHKTGKNRTGTGLVIDGGRVLQPVLYSLVVERVTGKTVEESRLSFCTAAGGFSEAAIALTPTVRRAGIEALEIVDRAIELGFLAPAPAPGACGWCDFRPVCGPNEEQRVARKPPDRLRDLLELRSRP